MSMKSQQDPVVTTLNQIFGIVVFVVTLVVVGGAVALWMLT